MLGYEFVGKLIQVGEEAKKEGYKIGDKVIALNKERYGGLAEQCIAEITVSRFQLIICILFYYKHKILGYLENTFWHKIC